MSTCFKPQTPPSLPSPPAFSPIAVRRWGPCPGLASFPFLTWQGGPPERLCVSSARLCTCARGSARPLKLCASASEARLPSPGTPPQGGAEVGWAHLPGSSPLLFQIRTGTGEPRLAGWLSEVGELGTTPPHPPHRDAPSQVTRAAHNMVALGHAGAVAGGWGGACLDLGPAPGSWLDTERTFKKIERI